MFTPYRQRQDVRWLRYCSGNRAGKHSAICHVLPVRCLDGYRLVFRFTGAVLTMA